MINIHDGVGSNHPSVRISTPYVQGFGFSQSNDVPLWGFIFDGVFLDPARDDFKIETRLS
jgi:hypothetical protein